MTILSCNLCGSCFTPRHFPLTESFCMIDYVALLLVFFYSLNFLLGSSQLAQVFEPRNTPWTNRNGILGFLTLSSLLRVIFWIIVADGEGTSPDTDQIVGILLDLPLWLNFAGLSLLALFYADSLGLYTTKDPVYVWSIVNTIFFVLCISLALIQSQPGIDSSQRYALSIAFVVYATTLDIVLASALGYFGFKFTAASPDESIKKKLLPRKRKTFILVNGVIVVMYLLRAVFTAIFAIPDVVPASKTTIDYSRDHGVTPGVAYAFFMLTEVIVVFCVFVLLWKKSTPRSNIVLLTAKSEDVGDVMDEHGVWRTTESGTVVGTTQNPINTLEARLLSEEDKKVQVIYNETPSPSSSNTIPSQSSTWWDSVVNGVVEPLNSSALMRSLTSSMASSGSSNGLHPGATPSSDSIPPPPPLPKDSSSEFIMFRAATSESGRKDSELSPMRATNQSIGQSIGNRGLSNQSFPRSSAYEYPPMPAGVQPMPAPLVSPSVNNDNDQSEVDAMATPPLWVHGNKPPLPVSYSNSEDPEHDSSPDVTVGGISKLQRFHHPNMSDHSPQHMAASMNSDRASEQSNIGLPLSYDEGAYVYHTSMLPAPGHNRTIESQLPTAPVSSQKPGKSHKKAASLHDPALLRSVQTPPMQRSANSMHNVASTSVIDDQAPSSLRDSLYNKDYHNSYNKTVGPWDILKRK